MEQDRDLVIDRTSGAVQLDSDTLATWAANKRVFISSTMGDLDDFRAAVAEAAEDIGAEPVWFEQFGGRDQDAEQAYESEVDSCDVYVGILGERYGRQLQSGFSATHAEYRRAIADGARVAVWVVVDETAMQGHQRAFLDEVRTFYVTESVKTPDQLRRRVAARLRKIAAEDLAPWVKLGPILFRASRIDDTATTITVTAPVKDPDVAHALTSLRPTWPAPTQSLQYTYGDRSVEVRVSDVSTTTVAGTAQNVRLALQPTEQQSASTAMMFSGYSEGGRTYTADDVIERQLRRVLFGDDLELPRHLVGDIDDPLAPLMAAGVSEEIVRPLMRLLLVEALVGTRRAARLTELRVGPPTPHGRHLRMSWETPRQLGSSARRSIEGTIRQ